MTHHRTIRTIIIAAVVALVSTFAAAGDGSVGRVFAIASPESPGDSRLFAIDVRAGGEFAVGESYALGTGSRGASKQPVISDPGNRFLFVGNNSSRDISSFRILEDGTLDPAGTFDATGAPFRFATHPSRQTGLLFASLTGEGIRAFRYGDDGTLTALDFVAVPGVRDIAITPDGAYLYATGPNTGVVGFEVSTDGSLRPLLDSPYAFPLAQRPKEIEITSDGSYLYVLDLDFGITAYEVGSFGDLTVLPNMPVEVGTFTNQMTLSYPDRFLHVHTPFRNQIHTYDITNGGAPVEVTTSPESSVAQLIEMINPQASSMMIEVAQGDRLRTTAYGDDGKISIVLDSVTVGGLDGRVFNGAHLIGGVGAGPGNGRPVARIASSRTECASPAATTVTLDGSGSTDDDSTEGTNDDIVMFEWYEGDTFLGQGETLETTFSRGDHRVTLKVTDATGNVATSETDVLVLDTTAPTLSIRLTPGFLAPADGEMIDVEASIDAADTCGTVDVRLVSITMRDPLGMGSTDDSGDSAIAGASYGDDDRTFQLRAKPLTSYVVEYIAIDEEGNFATRSESIRTLNLFDRLRRTSRPIRPRMP